MKKRTMVGAFVLAAGCAAGWVSSAAGGLLLDERWADGDYTDGDAGPSVEAPVWTGSPDRLTATTGSLSATVSTNSMKLWTYFAADGGEATLAPSEKLVVTLEVVLHGGLYDQASRGYRIGLYNDPTDPQVRQNINDDGGGDGDPWADATGYAVELALGKGPQQTANPIQLFKRVNTHASLLGSSGAMSSASSGGRVITFALDTPYTLTFEISRVSESRTDLTFSIADDNGVRATQTVRDDGHTFDAGSLPGSDTPFATFEQLFIRTTSSQTSADAMEYRGIRVEHMTTD